VKEIKKNYYSGAIFTVAHNKFKIINIDSFRKKLKINNFVYDLKNIFFKDKVDLTL
jgi:UDP-N-acetyl-D-mannosaminuronate dehydrogenase